MTKAPVRSRGRILTFLFGHADRSPRLLKYWLCHVVAAAIVHVCVVTSDDAVLSGKELREGKPSSQPAPTPVAQSERRPLNGVRVPYPGSAVPQQVVANIAAAATQTHLAGFLGVPDVATGKLVAHRVLQVKSDEPPAGYLVAELYDSKGNAVVRVAITRNGDIMGAEDLRGIKFSKPLDLADAADRVKRRRGRDATLVEYEYFNNVAEGGVSVLRPLTVVRTERGAVYFNSRGEAFVEDDTPIQAEFQAVEPSRRLPPGLRKLRKVSGL